MMELLKVMIVLTLVKVSFSLEPKDDQCRSENYLCLGVDKDNNTFMAEDLGQKDDPANQSGSCIKRGLREAEDSCVYEAVIFPVNGSSREFLINLHQDPEAPIRDTTFSIRTPRTTSAILVRSNRYSENNTISWYVVTYPAIIEGDKENICEYRKPGSRRLFSGTAFILNQKTCHLTKGSKFQYFNITAEKIKLRVVIEWDIWVKPENNDSRNRSLDARWEQMGDCRSDRETSSWLRSLILQILPHPLLPEVAKDKSGGLPIWVYIVIGIVALIGLVVIICCIRRCCNKPAPKHEPKKEWIIKSPKSTATSVKSKASGQKKSPKSTASSVKSKTSIQKLRSELKLWRSFCIDRIFKQTFEWIRQ